MHKILVVEDSSFQRRIIRETVSVEGRQVFEASNVDDALKIIQSQKLDLILSDILMPVKTGIDLLKQLKADGVKIPVIMLSADIQEPVRKECMDLGAVGFISKPLAGDSLKTLNVLLSEYLG
jgi:twitching motility two-component system response regulator PilH